MLRAYRAAANQARRESILHGSDGRGALNLKGGAGGGDASTQTTRRVRARGTSLYSTSRTSSDILVRIIFFVLDVEFFESLKFVDEFFVLPLEYLNALLQAFEVFFLLDSAVSRCFPEGYVMLLKLESGK